MDYDEEIVEEVMGNNENNSSSSKIDQPENPKISISKYETFKKLNSAQCLRVIHAVAENECLWNLKNSNYKNSNFKQMTWANLEKDLSFFYSDHGYNLKKAWNSLKGAYDAERKRENQPSGSGAKIVRKFPFYDEMNFLKESIMDKSPPPSSDSSTSVIKRVSKIETQKRKRQRIDAEDDDEKEYKEFMKTSTEILKKIEERNKAKTEEFASVTNLLVETLKSIDATSQLQLQGEIASICRKYSKKENNLSSFKPPFPHLDPDDSFNSGDYF